MGWPALAALIFAGVLLVGHARALDLVPGMTYRGLATQVEFLEDSARALSIEDVRGAARRLEFQPLNKPRINFGFTHSRYWLRLPVANRSAEDGEWILSLNVRFMHGLEAYLIDGEGTPRRLIRDGDTLPFAERDVMSWVLAVPFRLAAGQSAVIHIGYWSEGSSALPISIETAADFQHARAVETAKFAAYYALMGFMVLFSLFFFLLTRAWVFLFYALFVGWVSLYVLQVDGLAFEFLWPGSPQWNAFAALPFGLGINVFAAMFARSFLRTEKQHPRLDRILLGFVTLTLLAIAASALLDEVRMKQFAFVYTFCGALLFLAAGVVAWRREAGGVRFYLVGWSGIVLASLASSLLHLYPGTLPVTLSFDLIRGSMLLDAIMMAMALIAQGNELRRERDRANRRELAVLQQKLALHRQVLELQARHAEAIGLAEARGQRLASAGHDLRQPLLAMRSAVQQVLRQSPAGRAAAETMARSLSYLERLIAHDLDAAAEVPRPAMPPAADGTERFNIAAVLDNVEFMFAEDALAKGLRLRFSTTTLTVEASPLAVMRIVSNLVSNAIKYTDRGAVLVGCRRSGGEVAVEVHDTGPGLDAAEWRRLAQAYVRGSHGGQGQGLGLAIVAGLAQENGYRLQVRGRIGRGTVVRLGLPRVAPGDRLGQKRLFRHGADA